MNINHIIFNNVFRTRSKFTAISKNNNNTLRKLFPLIQTSVNIVDDIISEIGFNTKI
jgi:hypothetical protein